MIFFTLLTNTLLESLKLVGKLKHCLFYISWSTTIIFVHCNFVMNLPRLCQQVMIKWFEYGTSSPTLASQSPQPLCDVCIFLLEKGFGNLCILKTNGVNMGHWNFTKKREAPFENLHVWHKWMLIFFGGGDVVVKYVFKKAMIEVSTELLFISFSLSLFQLLTITKWNFGTWMICVFKHFSL